MDKKSKASTLKILLENRRNKAKKNNKSLVLTYIFISVKAYKKLYVAFLFKVHFVKNKLFIWETTVLNNIQKNFNNSKKQRYCYYLYPINGEQCFSSCLNIYFALPLYKRLNKINEASLKILVNLFPRLCHDFLSNAQKITN